MMVTKGVLFALLCCVPWTLAAYNGFSLPSFNTENNGYVDTVDLSSGGKRISQITLVNQSNYPNKPNTQYPNIAAAPSGGVMVWTGFWSLVGAFTGNLGPSFNDLWDYKPQGGNGGMAYITQDSSKVVMVDAWRGISDPDSPPRLMVFNAQNGKLLDHWDFNTQTETLGETMIPCPMSKDTRYYVLKSNWTSYTFYNATVVLMAIDLDLTTGTFKSAWNYTLTELNGRLNGWLGGSYADYVSVDQTGNIWIAVPTSIKQTMLVLDYNGKVVKKASPSGVVYRPLTLSTPAGKGGVFTVETNKLGGCSVYSYDSNLKEIWEQNVLSPPKDGFYTWCTAISLAVMPNTNQEVLLATGDYLYAFDSATGKQIWQWGEARIANSLEVEGEDCTVSAMPAYPPITTVDGTILFCGYCGNFSSIFAVDLATGNTLATYITDGNGGFSGGAYAPYVLDSFGKLWTGIDLGLGGDLSEFLLQ